MSLDSSWGFFVGRKNMQKEDLTITNKETATPEAMAQKLNVSKEFIQKLCKQGVLSAYYDDNGWNIFPNRILPAVNEFKHISDDENFKILRGEYEVSFIETIDGWTECLLNNTDYIEFQDICIEEMTYEDSDGVINLKIVITREQFLNVAPWNSDLKQFLNAVNKATANDSYIVGVFDNKTEAYVYARKMFDEINLMDKVKLKYLCNNHLIPGDTIKLLKN